MHTTELLSRGVERGVITDTQRASLLALGAERESPREAARGFNAITVAYGAGAFIVLFAFSWFLVDRWRALGAQGLLLVSLVYAVAFFVTARVLGRAGFPVARGIAMLLAVAMAPLATWAFGRWAGIWPSDLVRMCGLPNAPFLPCDLEQLTAELAGAGAALAALRRVKFAPLVIPLAVAGLMLPVHAVRAWEDGASGSAFTGWTSLLAASVMLAAAYTVDRKQGQEDYAAWLHRAAAIAGFFACAQLFDSYTGLRHLTGLVVLLAFAAAVYLRRRVYLVVGAGMAFAYLAWLAAEVFRLTVAFPLVLAVLGLAIILGAVWLQSRFPALVARAGGAASGPPRLPGGAAVLLAPAVLAVLMLPSGVRHDREREPALRERSRAAAAARARNSRQAPDVSPPVRTPQRPD